MGLTRPERNLYTHDECVMRRSWPGRPDDDAREKRFCYTNKIICLNILLQQQKCFSSVNKTFGCYSKILVATTKILFVVHNFVAVTKPFFPCGCRRRVPTRTAPFRRDENPLKLNSSYKETVICFESARTDPNTLHHN